VAALACVDPWESPCRHILMLLSPRAIDCLLGAQQV
jgi:hypothetical protein